MKTINLKEFYPEIYTADTFCEIPEEVLEELLSFRRKENAAKRKVYRNKAYYSLDRNDGVEHGSEGCIWRNYPLQRGLPP